MMGGAQSGAGSIPLKLELVQLILDRCPSVASASPVYQTRSQVILENKNWNTMIQGVNENFAVIGNWTLDPTYPGRFLEKAEVDSGAAVCVLGADTVTNILSGADPIGKIIRVRNVPFTVVGVLKAKGQSGGPGGSRDDIILAPYTTVSNRLIGGGTPTLNSIQVSAVNEESTDTAMAEISEFLREYNKLEPGEADNFTVRNMADIAESAADSTNILTVLLGSIASISLLVGGIGIMNIMLVSVSERIREIGIRMAIGAQKIDILVQFLFEAVVLSLVGGLLGILLGYGASKLLRFIPMFATITTIVSPGSVLLAFGFSAFVGIFFGYYPARKAARMDPIEALRYE